VNLPVIYATHKLHPRMSLSYRSEVMTHARLQQLGMLLDVYEQSAHRLGAEFMGTVNILSGVVVQETSEVALVALPGLSVDPIAVPKSDSIGLGTPVSVAVRPEDVKLQPPCENRPAHIDGTIIERAYYGNSA